MNQQQRKFLIDKINSKVKQQIREIEDLRTEAPSIKNYLIKEIASGSIELKTVKEIKDNLKKLALGKQKMKTSRYHSANFIESGYGEQEALFNIPVSSLINIPKDFDKRYQNWQIDDEKLKERIASIEAQTEALITRIQLASDKVLDGMIKEIDDMGNISLMDKTLRNLIAPSEPIKKQRQLGYGK